MILDIDTVAGTSQESQSIEDILTGYKSISDESYKFSHAEICIAGLTRALIDDIFYISIEVGNMLIYDFFGNYQRTVFRIRSTYAVIDIGDVINTLLTIRRRTGKILIS